jgi:hypothetical protein
MAWLLLYRLRLCKEGVSAQTNRKSCVKAWASVRLKILEVEERIRRRKTKNGCKTIMKLVFITRWVMINS